jgi:hypothetical protein
MEYLLHTLSLVTFLGLCFFASAFLSAYKEAKVTTKFINKIIIGCTLLGVAALGLFLYFDSKESIYAVGAMFAFVVMCVSVYPKIKSLESH